MAAPSARALQPELAMAMSSASALERSCTIRSAKGREGVWWADSESYNRCAVDNRLAGHCGEQRPANLTTCVSVEGETYTKEFIVGPFVTTGGNDWTAINYVATLGALEDGMEPADLAIRDYSFTNVRDSPWGAQLGFPPLHNHHTTMHGADGDCESTTRCSSTFWLEQQADAQCSGEVDGYACLDHDLRPGGYYYPLRSDAPLTQNCLWNDVRAAGSPPITWYFKATLRFERAGESASDLLPAAQWEIEHPWHAGTSDNTLDVPMGRESFFVMEGTHRMSGTIVSELSHVHTHSQKFRSSFLIAASAAELGLDAAVRLLDRLRPRHHLVGRLCEQRRDAQPPVRQVPILLLARRAGHAAAVPRECEHGRGLRLLLRP